MQEQTTAFHFLALQKMPSESSPDRDSIMQSLTSLAFIGAMMHTICAPVAKRGLSLTLLHFFDYFFGKSQPALHKLCLVSPSNTFCANNESLWC